MRNILDESPVKPFYAWLQLVTFGGYVLAGFFLFNILAPLVALPFFGFDVSTTLETIGNPVGKPEARAPLLITQAFYSFGAFFLTPWFFINKYLKMSLPGFIDAKRLNYQPIVLCVVGIFCFMVVNSVLIQFNKNIQFPEILSGVENVARSFEDKLEGITMYITDFQSIWQFLFGLVVIAVFPAIGEELLFRGVLQNLFRKTFSNPHVAIWLSAFLFGAFHLQFYGVLPRMMLGVLFGYFYYWSGHLWLAMLAHFINNGFTLVAVYLSNRNIVDYEINDMNAQPPFISVLFFFVIGTITLITFYKYFNPKALND
ncbi:MAG: CPBP family intramembrane metalloprotease [Cyclobacteriaceae bacterium]|nr:CPBP family intramembrane metalloprotease [Cyclobacteriaceae bacterium HetDA_MAG_MS6]